jgi:hypothetical protein
MYLFAAASSPAPAPSTTALLIPSGFALLIGIGWFIIHVAFAIGVYADATEQEGKQQTVWFGGAMLWGFATLMGGVFVAVAYWLLHHSSLSVATVSKKTLKRERAEATPVYTAPVVTPEPPPEEEAPVVSPYALAAPPAPPPEPTPAGGSRPDIDDFQIERTPLDS